MDSYGIRTLSASAGGWVGRLTLLSVQRDCVMLSLQRCTCRTRGDVRPAERPAGPCTDSPLSSRHPVKRTRSARLVCIQILRAQTIDIVPHQHDQESHLTASLLTPRCGDHTDRPSLGRNGTLDMSRVCADVTIRWQTVLAWGDEMHKCLYRHNLSKVFPLSDLAGNSVQFTVEHRLRCTPRRCAFVSRPF